MEAKVTVYLLFVGFMVLISSMGIYLYWTASVGILEERTIDYMDAIAEAKADHVNYFLEREVDRVISLSNDHHFSDILLGLSERSPLYGELNFDHYRDVLDKALDKEYEIFILNLTGQVVASSDSDSVGVDKSNDAYFLGVQGKDYFIKDAYFSESTGRKSIAISAPVKNSETGEILGFIVARIEINTINEITMDRTGLGVSGEAYIINRDSVVLTNSRSGSLDVLVDSVDTFRSRECIDDFSLDNEEKEGEDPVVYKNYNDRDVLGVDSQIKEIDWCLIVEISEKEAIGGLKEDLVIVALQITLIAVFLMVIFIFIANHILLRK